MNFDEFLQNKKYFEKAVKCKDIYEFKKLVDESDVSYLRQDQIKKAWSYVRTHVPAEDGGLDDNDLDAVSGGLMVYGCFPDKSLLAEQAKQVNEAWKKRNSNN